MSVPALQEAARGVERRGRRPRRASAYTVVGALGLPVDGYAIPYLTSWSQDTDLGVVEQAAALIDRLAKRIEDSVLAVAPRHAEAELEDAAPADD
jgi:hypothetical protein